jgi:hypothetical protein
MRIISYKLFLESSQDSIESICEMYGIINYTINEDGSIDVDGNVNLSGGYLLKLPLKFRHVTGYFDCSKNQLNSLEGSPLSVGAHFDCSYNQLVNLIGGPEVVIDDYYAHCNQINSFEGFPDDFEGDCYFRSNPVQKVLKEFPHNLKVKVIHLIIDYDAIWNGEVIPERIEMIKDKLGLI